MLLRPFCVEITPANVNDVEIGKKTPVEAGANDVHLHAVDAAVRAGEIVELAQRNGGRIDEAQEFCAVAAGSAVEFAGETREQIGEDADVDFRRDLTQDFR